MKKKWIVKIRRDVGEHFKITKMTVVCSKHFKQEDYRAWTPVRKCLKPTSVPSVFDWSSDKPKRRALKRKILADYSVQVSTGDDSLPQQASSSTAEFTETLIQKDTIEIERLQKELADQKVENEFLNQQLQLEKFGITRFSLNSSLVSFYTGFSSYFAFPETCRS
ncbi:uncharacterized protein LOC128230695 [Mya arenaria]|uniref:uncharacterized protein LOC128230695 n=1 Tax=Mya arenaria TaxID=6604 RepID=UPI0022E4548D|nr:uncharacterized protein LOC128230695 [Mya arenaria]